MNVHAILDIITVSLSGAALRSHKFFSRSIECPSLVEHLDNTVVQLPEIAGQGKYEVGADTLVGNLDPAFYITQWKGDEYATILYHHGSNERPFDFRRGSPTTFKNIFLRTKQPIQANLIALCAPFHRTSITYYVTKLGDLANFVAMLSVSVKVIDELVLYLKQRQCPRVMVSGISLGGWITNIHRAYYNTADVYVPLLAGAALGDIFTTSIYRKMTGRLAQENPAVLRRVLDFENAFKQVETDNVYPLLARHDQIIRYDRQRPCYGERRITTLEKGHVTAALVPGDLRAHILARLDDATQG
ncbi:MAG: hypothetical protein JW878_10730 [Methanomicrobia archaeon]|nr:hypothetical protein [Methanomicrobia archaeon]